MLIFQRKFLASAYYASLSLCFIIPFVFFLSWNNIDFGADDEMTLPISSFHVDSCALSGNSAFVSGWAVADGVTNSQIRVYLLSGSNSKVELFTSMQRRPDVSAYLSSPGTYDKSGFYSSRMSMKNEFKSKYILISLTDLNGKTYEAKYECV
ncbi:hypothetical protein FR731_25530 [Enterobacter hormaechei]|uniref:hypothetical protein n=1 Tax=Enterobacter cloacae complex TaxID=354276 RepID=UPI001184731C|nr:MULTISPECIES: hypothetical protein [Enterobacter cloacae complex]EKM8121794.1 hypothetical protein [Enterobacter hormaechei]TWX74598.1 hypothetical protein FR731_25530 [Enterobacter hormaechei]